ncbi:phage baseplate assembly protein [Bosea sp. LjRoot9]|uniref:phage baseplate assembly protein domain-containing protein n=1 Tax=Bosea sp. LjRoot9 TaxID=3342341 RepID=UPI003ECE7304
MITEFGEASTVTRGKVVAINDSARGQTITIDGYSGERFTGVLRGQPHGFSSHPPIGSIGYFLRQGSSDRLTAIGYESEGRPVNSPVGTAVLYDDNGNQIFAKGSDGVSIKAVNGGVMVESDTGTITLKRGTLTVTVSATRVDLGGTGGQAVQTVGGPSTKVFAIL